MVIGTDFDNTLVDYDRVFASAAVARGWLADSPDWNKKSVRDALRLQPDGENRWQHLQAQAYGWGIQKAVLFAGVRAFVARCRANGAALFIVSHKTQFPSLKEYTVDLHKGAWLWMEEQGFFLDNGLGFARTEVFLEPTRAAKLERIRLLGCTHFIDDMEETFNERDFPGGVERILFDPWNAGCANPGVRRFNKWPLITDFICGPG